MVPRFPPRWFVFVTVQVTGTVAPPEVKAEQFSALPDETVVADCAVVGSTQVTVLIEVAATIVTAWVPVKLLCACAVAVMVTAPLAVVGTVAGAVYNPAEVIEPLPVPLTDQFTSVLLKFKTVAVHCEVPSTVTSTGVQETVIVGVVVVLALEPQEFSNADAAITTIRTATCCQRTVPRCARKFDSNT
jgi:hypothetical protein